MNQWLLWALGMSVVPVPRPGQDRDGKRPVIPWKRYQTEVATSADMARWFAGPSNYAVVTGAVSGVVVLDIDDRSARRWVRWNMPPTPWVVKTSRGWHCYYRHPGVAIGNRARIEGIKLDVRGDGGYVIGPGSFHSSGFVYRATGDWSVPRRFLPVFDASMIAKDPPRAARPPINAIYTARGERARSYILACPRPIIGQGSDAATFSAACKLLRGFDLQAPEVVTLIREWAPDFSIDWIERKVASAAANGEEPIGGRL